MTADWSAWVNWSKDVFLKKYGHLSFSGGPVPYGRRVFGRDEKELNVKRFISKQMKKTPVSILDQVPTADTEPWILFDRDIDFKSPDLMKDFVVPDYFRKYGIGKTQISIGSFGSGAPWYVNSFFFCKL